MADTVHVNLSGVERRLDRVEASTQRIENAVAQANQQISAVSKELGATKQELQELKESFLRFLDESRKTATLQKAATELIRVRQEIEQKFGNYKVVRDTMLGVLQATDLALVKKTTISQVTEELMLSTPDYWLAPCLVAVSAWIGNDRDLANRAITEAVKRDEEKTALTMALICRRNNRVDTCYEWLSLYFAKQSAKHFTASNFTYLTAYLNGVFGPDEKHMCDDYVAKWMSEVKSSSGEDFEAQQIELWRAYCEDFTVDLAGQFPHLSNCVHEYDDISAYVSRINSVDNISGNFSRMKNAEIDQEQLKKDIDQTLVALVSKYDEKEEPLRREEQYLLAVRYFDGDSSAARTAILDAERKKTEDTIDLVAQMTNVIVKKGTSPSEKKTAVSFLNSYIRNGFDKYITEKRSAFPQQITMGIEGWRGSTSDGSNAEILKADFEQYMEQCRAGAIAAIPTDGPKTRKIIAVVLALAGILGFFVVGPLSLALLIGAVVCFFSSSGAAKKIVENTAGVNADFDQRIITGKQQIDGALDEWVNAKKLVQSFESEKTRDVVA